MHKLRYWLMIAAIVSVSFGTIVALVVSLARGEFKFFYRAEFTEFYVCQGPDPVTGLPREPVAILPSSVETIYVCGYLETNGKVPLFFLLFYDGKSTRWFDPEEQYQTGYVIKELPQSRWQPGNYRVEVRLQRHLVASTEFAVVP